MNTIEMWMECMLKVVLLRKHLGRGLRCPGQMHIREMEVLLKWTLIADLVSKHLGRGLRWMRMQDGR